jgi:hypothetical protein
MCSIVGYVSSNPTQEHMKHMVKIIDESIIRGQHAYGLAYENQVKKYYQSEYDGIILPLTNKLIFHSRYSTSGDFRIHDNNQPLTKDNTHLVFNGVIDMSVEYNDGLLVLEKETPEEMLEYISTTNCSFSGLVLKDDVLYGFRNPNRPAWILEYDGATFIASTRDIFVRALGDVEPVEMNPNQLYIWN